MAKIYLLGDHDEVMRRRRAAPTGTSVEAWMDVFEPNYFWVPEVSKQTLDDFGRPLKSLFVVEAEAIPIFYVSPVQDLTSLPPEESLRVRTLAGHGIGVAWVTCDQHGQRISYDPSSHQDAFFFLRRMGTDVNHLWRLFRSREDARWFVEKYLGGDPHARTWPDLLPAEDFEDFLKRYRTS